MWTNLHRPKSSWRSGEPCGGLHVRHVHHRGLPARGEAMWRQLFCTSSWHTAPLGARAGRFAHSRFAGSVAFGRYVQRNDDKQMAFLPIQRHTHRSQSHQSQQVKQKWLMDEKVFRETKMTKWLHSANNFSRVSHGCFPF